MSTAIEFNNVSKQYKLGLVSTKTLSHDLNRWWQTKILRKEDPYLKIGSVNDRASKADSDYVWALKDIDFKVEQGDVVGIIGKNGAGKSTLLKLLSRVTNPTTGTIRAKGRIASLLEVGTGFHPELTGRENIYMNGSIMGMNKAEITRKLDEIVAFSGCERYIDTPVKRYSSGMTVRLGFAIAAHLDPEILVVDEVLAVGDAEFQKKAIGKMQDVSKGEGRTVLFVSHNMASIQSLCKNGVLLNNGMIETFGLIDDVIRKYVDNQKTLDDFIRTGDGDARAIEFQINKDVIYLGDNLEVTIPIRVNEDIDLLNITIDIYNEDGLYMAHVTDYDSQLRLTDLKSGEEIIVQCIMNNMNFSPGTYYANIWLGNPYTSYDIVRRCIKFRIIQGNSFIKRETPYEISKANVVIQSLWNIL